MDTPTAITVFFSYSHKDKRYQDRLATFLKAMERRGEISSWHDGQLTAGTEWRKEIETQLESARVILLLVSADFLASDFCHSVELKRAMERHEAGTARVVPIIVKPCDWHSESFGKLQALPKDGKPITRWQRQDDAFLDVGNGIRKVTEEVRGHP